jgi:hypothetical protein|tara:strand:- start:4113 stop:4499 length:387 start_codon:yes stop_codon:yes gene_type:complete
MIYFDWKKILEASHGNVGDIITILRIVTYKLTPKNYYDKTFRFYEKSFHGSSFLVNPVALLEKGRAFSDKEVAEYVGVASFRNSFEYAKTKDTTLDLIYSQVSENTINQNRLLEIRDGIIHFKYEETL